ncbi:MULTISPECIES: hypothetical protein [unclassified Thalassolituus]|nr:MULTISPECIES: hypothetical protein [unclassified Thalassolituus]
MSLSVIGTRIAIDIQTNKKSTLKNKNKKPECGGQQNKNNKTA